MKAPVIRQLGRVRAVSAGILVAMLAAVACSPLSEGEAAKARTESNQTAVSGPPEMAEEPAFEGGGQSLEPATIDPPAPPGSRSPALAAERPATVTKEPEILMTWLTPGESGGRLRFARLSGRAWSQPITIAENVSTLGPTDRPSLTVIDTQAVRRTLIAHTGDVVARSGDGGRTWSRLPAPVLPYASFAGGDEGAYVFWLAAEEGGLAKLLGTRVLTGETVLDPRASGDSGTSAAMTWDGPVVVYRGRAAEGGLDIAIVRRQDAQWTVPRLVHTEGWRPVQSLGHGPQVAALRRQVAVAWYTEVPNGPRVLVAFSSDAGRTFAAPFEVDAREKDQRPGGPVAVTLDESGDALVLWTATVGPAGARINLTRVSPEGSRGEDLVVAKGLSVHPGNALQITRAGSRVAATWVEGVPASVRAVEVPLATIPAVRSGPRDSPTLAVVASVVSAGRGRVGDPVPNHELVSLDGDEVSLASLPGRVVLLNFWATWCRPCVAEMPELAALHDRYEAEGLVVVGVTVDSEDAFDKVHTFASDLKIPFAVWLDPEMQVYRALRVRGLPTTLIIDVEGRIVLRRDQAIAADDAEIINVLRRALSDQ